MPVLEKRDLYWCYEWFVLICLCFLNLSWEKHIIKKCCFISKITFHTWIYFVSLWNCLRPLVRLIFKTERNNQTKKNKQKKAPKNPKPTSYSTFFFLLLLLLLEIFIACSYDIKSTRNNLWLPYLCYLCCRSVWVLIVAEWCWGTAEQAGSSARVKCVWNNPMANAWPKALSGSKCWAAQSNYVKLTWPSKIYWSLDCSPTHTWMKSNKIWARSLGCKYFHWEHVVLLLFL